MVKWLALLGGPADDLLANFFGVFRVSKNISKNPLCLPHQMTCGPPTGGEGKRLICSFSVLCLPQNKHVNNKHDNGAHTTKMSHIVPFCRSHLPVALSNFLLLPIFWDTHGGSVTAKIGFSVDPDLHEKSLRRIRSISFQNHVESNLYVFVFVQFFFCFPFRIISLSVQKDCVRYYMVTLSYKIGSIWCM